MGEDRTTPGWDSDDHLGQGVWQVRDTVQVHPDERPTGAGSIFLGHDCTEKWPTAREERMCNFGPEGTPMLLSSGGSHTLCVCVCQQPSPRVTNQSTYKNVLKSKNKQN